MKESHVDLSWYGHCESNAQRKLISHETNAWFQKKKSVEMDWNERFLQKQNINVHAHMKQKFGAAIVIHFFICLFNSISSKQSMTKWLRGTILDWVSTHDSKKHRIRIKKNKLLRPTSPKPWLFWNFVEQMRFWSNQIISSPLQLPSETILRIQWLEWHPCGHRVVPAAPKI